MEQRAFQDEFTWAFSEAAVLSLRTASTHGKPKALSILAHQLGRTVYYVLLRDEWTSRNRRGISCGETTSPTLGRDPGNPRRLIGWPSRSCSRQMPKSVSVTCSSPEPGDSLENAPRSA